MATSRSYVLSHLSLPPPLSPSPRQFNRIKRRFDCVNLHEDNSELTHRVIVVINFNQSGRFTILEYQPRWQIPRPTVVPPIGDSCNLPSFQDLLQFLFLLLSLHHPSNSCLKSRPESGIRIGWILSILFREIHVHTHVCINKVITVTTGD